jgi:hypothetical protein
MLRQNAARINLCHVTAFSYSQNILSQIRKIFVTLGLNTLSYLDKKFFLKQMSLKVDVTYNKNNKMPIFYV